MVEERGEEWNQRCASALALFWADLCADNILMDGRKNEMYFVWYECECIGDLDPMGGFVPMIVEFGFIVRVRVVQQPVVLLSS